MIEHDDPAENEIMATARAARHHKEAAERAGPRSWAVATTIGVGIGSAAVAAALLYATRGRKKD